MGSVSADVVKGITENQNYPGTIAAQPCPDAASAVACRERSVLLLREQPAL